MPTKQLLLHLFSYEKNITLIFINVKLNGKPIIYKSYGNILTRKFLAAKNTLSNFRYNSIINFLALTLTMSRHAVKVRNQEEGIHVLTDKYIVDVYCTCCVKSIRFF